MYDEQEKLITIRPRYENVPVKALNGVIFQYGVADVSNLDDDDFAKLLKYFRRCYGGRTTTYGQLQDEASRAPRAIPHVRREILPPGSGSYEGRDDGGERHADPEAGAEGISPEGDGSERAATDEVEKIREAVELLDPADDEHWTPEGQPRVDAVAEVAGLPGLTRDQISIAVPDAHRPAVEE